MNPIEIIIHDERLGQQFALPSYSTDGAAGLDLICCHHDKVFLHPNDKPLNVSTGISICIHDASIMGIIVPRASYGADGLICGNGVGILNSDSQTPIMLSAWNRNKDKAISIEPGESFAQLIFVPVIRPEIQTVETFTSRSERRKINHFPI